MTRYAEVHDGLVSDILDIPAGAPPLNERVHRDLLPLYVSIPDSRAALVAPGWLWDGADFTLPPAMPMPLPAVPREVSNFQARAMLLSMPASSAAGGTMFETVDASLRAQGGVAWQAWEYANTVTRDGPLVAHMATQIGLGTQQIDALFIAASKIEA